MEITLLLVGFVASVIAVSEDDLFPVVQSKVADIRVVNLNVSFRCMIARNTSTGLDFDFYNYSQVLDIQWTFRPVGSQVDYILMGTNETQSPGLDIDGTLGPAGASKVKYHRLMWPHLTVMAVVSQDAGTYTCVLSKTGKSSSAELYVIDENPKCTEVDPNVTFYAGDNVSFTCSAHYFGNHPPLVEWREPVLHVDFNKQTITHQNSSNTVSTSVHFQLQRMIDGKPFKCNVGFQKVDNLFTCQSMFQPETVLYPPFITHIRTMPETEEHNRRVNEGSNVTLFCTGHSMPAPNWSWTFVSEKNITMEGVCSSEVCPMHNIQLDKTGTYTCSISNVIRGQQLIATQSIYLTVIRSPHVILSTSQPMRRASTPAVTVLEDKGVSPYAIAAIVCASLAVVLIIVFVMLALKVRTRERRLHDRLTRMHDENLDDQEVELLDENIQPDTSELPAEYGRLKQQWEIARKDIRLVDLIAKGSFVEVWRGRMRKYPRRNEIMKVAIKRIVSESTEKEKKFFLAELEVLKAIQPHPNVLPLIGCYTGSDPWLMMVEFATDGSLYQYLQHRRPGDVHVEIHSEAGESVSLKNNQTLSSHKLVSLAAQCVNGLLHINRFKMIYYRLRAASILVCKGGVCKLAGFGFVPDITERNNYETNSAPVRWMSPESLLDNVYNVKTDIWSFGVLLWEIVHFGHLPYPDMGPHEVSEKIHTGYRMPQPPQCSGDIYNLMLMCWAQNPENRPSFGDILQNLTHLAEHAESHIRIDRLPEGLKSSDFVENTSAIA